MGAPDLKGFVQAGFDILSSRLDPKTKKILLQIGSVVGKTVDSDAVEQWQQYGYVSRAPKPEAGKRAAQCVVIRTGDHDLAIASADLRGLELYGSLDYGEVALYSAGEDGNGQARVLLKKDGSVNAYTKVGNSPGGAGMVMQLDPTNNAARVLNGLGYGLIADTSGVVITAGENAALTLGADGKASLIGTGETRVDGSLIILGSNPAAVPGLFSALRGVTGVAGSASLKVIIAD